MAQDGETSRTVGAVIIGRNEGARLVMALDAAQAQTDVMVYVDSGSTDESLAEAEAREAETVLLDTSVPFTAARARNAGLERLSDRPAPPDYVQFIDGDCALRDGWIDTAAGFLDAHPDVAAVAGRRREVGREHVEACGPCMYKFPRHHRRNRIVGIFGCWQRP